METSRGRWFLGEYAKRNRNADTKMVLDAVSRIEETLAAQKKPVRDPLLDQALASLRAALTQARDAAQVALADLALEQNLGAGAQGRPRHPRDRLAFARNRRRRPDLRFDRLPGRRDRRGRGQNGAGRSRRRAQRRLRPDRGKDRSLRCRRGGSFPAASARAAAIRRTGRCGASRGSMPRHRLEAAAADPVASDEPPVALAEEAPKRPRRANRLMPSTPTTKPCST